jgi:hypothetical protein
MQLVKLITPKRIKTLHCFYLTVLVLILSMAAPVFGQDNSPYSRYGIGDLVPPTNVTTRAMGGLSAGYTDFLTVNFSNPASYSSFQAFRESKTKKLSSGRAILDIGVNAEGRTLKESSTGAKFKASNALFSYVQIGIPIKKNWGVSFGLRPVSRISYNMYRNERLKDPFTGLPIDSATTSFTGDGGAYVATLGTGFALYSKIHTDKEKEGMEEKLSIGFNAGYYFGKKDYSTRRSLLNDTVAYYSTNYETKTTFGNLFLNAGIQYARPLKNKKMLTLGAFGSLGQKLNARQDVLRETYLYDATLGNVRLDSVSDFKDVAGKIELPATFTVGFVLQKFAVINKEGGWIFGIDFNMQNWDNYRYYGQRDSVKNKWEIKAGGEFRPIPKRNYFSNVAYRFGVFAGPDYVKVGNQKLGQFGGSFGLGLPLKVSRQAPNQNTNINLTFEYGKRGNSNNILSENLMRFSLGFSLSDIWFIKRKYD